MPWVVNFFSVLTKKKISSKPSAKIQDIFVGKRAIIVYRGSWDCLLFLCIENQALKWVGVTDAANQAGHADQRERGG